MSSAYRRHPCHRRPASLQLCNARLFGRSLSRHLRWVGRASQYEAAVPAPAKAILVSRRRRTGGHTVKCWLRVAAVVLVVFTSFSANLLAQTAPEEMNLGVQAY